MLVITRVSITRSTYFRKKKEVSNRNTLFSSCFQYSQLLQTSSIFLTLKKNYNTMILRE